MDGLVHWRRARARETDDGRRTDDGRTTEMADGPDGTPGDGRRTPGASSEAGDDEGTTGVLEQAVGRMSFDGDDDEDARARERGGGSRGRGEGTSGAVAATTGVDRAVGRPRKPPRRGEVERESVEAAGRILLEDASPRGPEEGGDDGDEDGDVVGNLRSGRRGFGGGGMGGKSVSVASFLPSSSVSPPRVHRFMSTLQGGTGSTPGSPTAVQAEKEADLRKRAADEDGSRFAPNGSDDGTAAPDASTLSTSAPDERASAHHPGSFPETFAEFKEQFGANPTPQSIPPPKYGDQGIIGEKHVLVMVGLPARGKTHMAKRLCQYLRFFHGANTRVFNVGEYRRKFAGAGQTSDYFASDNKAVRMKFAQAALKDMIDFLFQEDSMSFLEQRGVDSGRVAIFDATNSTRERRRWIVDQLSALPLKLLFIESICTDEAVVEKNIRIAKISNCDYNGIMTPERAFEDFMQRVRNYEKEYQPMGVDPEEDDLSFIKLIDCGRRVESNRVHGYLLGRIAQFLSNMHATTCSIYLSRHGQSEYNALQKVGGDSVLTQMGENYALKLADFADQVVSRDPKTGEPRPTRLWTSSLQRTILTARHIQHEKIKTSANSVWVQMAPRVLRNLDEIYAGVCDGMTYEEIRAGYPAEFELRRQNKLSYRYPRGESYLDVIARLDPLIQELESYREDVLIVGHQGVLRLIYAYFAGFDRVEAATLSIPLNTVIKLTPRTHDCIEERFCLYDPAETTEPLDPPSY